MGRRDAGGAVRVWVEGGREKRLFCGLLRVLGSKFYLSPFFFFEFLTEIWPVIQNEGVTHTFFSLSDYCKEREKKGKKKTGKKQGAGGRERRGRGKSYKHQRGNVRVTVVTVTRAGRTTATSLRPTNLKLYFLPVILLFLLTLLKL